MAVMNGMGTYEARLASFGIAHSIKKRGSDAKGSKQLKWPHETPHVEQVGCPANNSTSKTLNPSS